MTSPLPIDDLESRAAEQRQHLHDAVTELRQTVRERLDVKRNVRDHLGPVTLALALLGLVLGYVAGGLLPRK